MFGGTRRSFASRDRQSTFSSFISPFFLLLRSDLFSAHRFDLAFFHLPSPRTSFNNLFLDCIEKFESGVLLDFLHFSVLRLTTRPSLKMGDNSAADEREALTSRIIPTMTLSTASSQLTAPMSPNLSTISPQERAFARFASSGNVVITGGAGALALAAARALLEHGADGVALLDLGSTLAISAASICSLRADFPKVPVLTIPVNVTDEARVTDAMRSAYEVFGSISILCCFAGVVGCVPSLDASTRDWTKVIDVNLTGSFLCAQAAAKYMIPGSGGSILFIASISAHSVNYPQPQAAYNVSKAGVIHLTRCLAAEWARYGIRVNSISPGYMDTVLNAGDSLKGVREVWAERCPMGRMGDVEELTGAVVMLCSARAGRYITGADLIVDGGLTCF